MALKEKWQQLMLDAVETKYSAQEDCFLHKLSQKGTVQLFVVPWTRRFKVVINDKVEYNGDDFEKALELL